MKGAPEVIVLASIDAPTKDIGGASGLMINKPPMKIATLNWIFSGAQETIDGTYQLQ